MANLDTNPKTHDLRKLATSYAFFKSMSLKEVCDLVGWASIRVFKKHYMQEIGEVSAQFVALGTEIQPSKEA